jgi:peptide/nickel transport system substrate-binding protein
MDESKLRGLIDRVKTGRLSRRGFVRRMLAVGLTVPMATQLLAVGGVAMAQTKSAYKPTKAGGGGTLKVLWWQGPTLLNPHFATGTKDQDGSRMFYEPLANWDPDGNLVPVLAAEIPTLDNGGLGEDGKSVTWKLKQGVKWHDGEPFTADDVVFNWEYARNKDTAAVTYGTYKDLKVEKVDDHTVRIGFDTPHPFWADAFVSVANTLIPKHLFEQYIGSKSRDAPTNLKPVGTGPYLFDSFTPGDLLTGKMNPNYHVPNQPYFDGFEMKGGGDAVSAARAVLQTGEYDFAWNMQVEDEILLRLEKGGKGKVVISETGQIEHIQVNFTDPGTEVDGERSSIKTTHPTLSDPAVREALALLCDRDSVQKYIYGRTGVSTVNYINNPSRFRSPNTVKEFNIQKASDILDKAGWKPGSDGIRAKDGKKLNYVFQTSINEPRQKTQAIIKQACTKAGIGIEIKSVVASVYFSSDVGNPDTYPHFYADLQMYTTGPNQPDPGIWMRTFLSSEVAQKSNKWQGVNTKRWRSPEFDKLWDAAAVEVDPVKRAAMFIQMNDLVVNQHVVMPLIYRPTVSAVAQTLRNVNVSGWDSDVADLAGWYREA